MQGLGDYISAAVTAIFILGIGLGILLCGAGYLLWYYVISRITVGWV